MKLPEPYRTCSCQAFTAGVYIEVAEELADAAAAVIGAYIPRRNHV